MLALTRKAGERIDFEHLGTTFSVTFPRIRGNRVTVAIDAPEEVQVVRGEVADREMNGEVVKVSIDNLEG